MVKIIDILFIKRFIEIRYFVEIQFVTITIRHQPSWPHACIQFKVVQWEKFIKLFSPDLLFRTSIIRSSVADVVMYTKKNKALSTPYEDTSSVARVVNK